MVGERKRRVWPWIGLALLLSYPLSFGPAMYMANRIRSPGDYAGTFVEIVYAPLLLACEVLPPLNAALEWYGSFFQ